MEPGENSGNQPTKKSWPPKITGSLEPLAGRCGAKLKFTGTSSENPTKYCKKYPLKGGNGRCERCGGKSPVAGPTHPTYKSGRWSKFLPEQIRERVNDAAADPELLSARRQVEIVDARLTMLLERIKTGESGSAWESLLEARVEFAAASQAIQKLQAQLQSASDDATFGMLQSEKEKQQKIASEAVNRVWRIIDGAAKSETAWREAIDLFHEHTQFQRAEIQTQVQLRQVMTAEQAMVFVMNVQQAIADTVKDPKEKAAIGLRLAQLLGRAGSSSITTPAAQPTAIAIAQIAPEDSPAPAGQGGAGEGEIIEGEATAASPSPDNSPPAP